MRDTTSGTLAWKFADMPSGVANRWLAWANSHDWGAGKARFLDTGNMLVETSFVDRDGSRGVETFIAKTPRELRDWAGY